MKILFLDLDGVLNGHAFDVEAKSSTISPACVERLNRVLVVTGCSLVISSAWRYMILNGAMTLTGFEYMLRTHRVQCVGRVVGHTEADVEVKDESERDPLERGRQVKAWVHGNSVTTYAVVDDMNLGFDGMPFVQTEKNTGLTDADADRLIKLLGSEAACG